MNTSTGDVKDDDLQGTVSCKFSKMRCYQEAYKAHEAIFPNGMCIFYELQVDPISQAYTNHACYQRLLEGYDKLTNALITAKNNLIHRNVIKKEWSERLTTALNKRKQIWSAGAAISDKLYPE